MSQILMLLGCMLLLAAAALIVRTDGTSLGPNSMRLFAIGIAVAGYYGAGSWLHGAGSPRPAQHWYGLHLLVPVAAAGGAIYCGWQVVQNWRSEVHGLAKGLLKLVMVLLLAVMARVCLSR